MGVEYDEIQSRLRLSNQTCTAEVSLLGAQVLSFKYHGEPDLLWLSSLADFSGASPIRGGIPICWPWFGSVAKPAHGWARTALWTLTGKEETAHEVTVRLAFRPVDQSVLRAELAITVSDRLYLKLTTINEGSQTAVLTEALHSYFQVSDVDKVRLEGMGECTYFDKLQNTTEAFVGGRMPPVAPFDQVYHSAHSPLLIVDEPWQRTITLEKQASGSTVLWNPGREASATIKDMHPEGYKNLLCVEAGNVMDQRVLLAPNSSHTLQCCIGRRLHQG